MKNLVRALKMAFRYRWSFVISMLASIGVAAMWGANIGAVAPFIKIVFENQTLPEWSASRITTTEKSIQEIDDRLSVIGPQTAFLEKKSDPESISKRNSLLSEKQSLDNRKDNLQAQLDFDNWMAPWIQDYAPSTTFNTLVLLITFMVIGTLLRGVFLITQMVLVARLGQRTVLDLQNQFFEKTLNMEMGEIVKNGTGDMVNRIRGETGAIGQAITTLLGKTVREPLKMVVCLLGAAYFSWRLLAISMLAAPLAAIGIYFLARSIKQLNKKAVEESARLLNRLFQSLTYIKVVKSFNMEASELQRFQVIAQDVYKKSMKTAFLGSLARVNNELLGVSMVGIGVLAGGYLVLTGKTTLLGITMVDQPMAVSTMLGFFAFLVATADPLRKLGDVFAMIQGGVVAADRVFPLLDKQIKISPPVNPSKLPRKPPTISFKDIEFAYEPGNPILKKLNLEFPSGKSVAIVGANGCGKSTLVNLLPRFFDPDSGQVLFDGVDIKDFRPSCVREAVGLVTQQSMLFDDSIAANIAYGRPDAKSEEIIQAAKKAKAHAFIEELEDGYETSVGEHGGKLSGGQRQRLELARVILKDPSVLILDEATSQIDPRSERLIHDSLAEFIEGRTVVMITHRLSTLELADLIVVMDDGKVIDFGTHSQLKSRCQVFQTMLKTHQDLASEDNSAGNKAA